MANMTSSFCYAKGKTKDLRRFLEILKNTSEDNDLWLPRTELINYPENISGNIASFYLNCAWSISSCWGDDDGYVRDIRRRPNSYFNITSEKMANVRSMSEITKELNIDVKVVSITSEDNFAEYYYWSKGKLLEKEVREYECDVDEESEDYYDLYDEWEEEKNEMFSDFCVEKLKDWEVQI